MDSNIDPAIESQAGIFTKFSLSSEFNNGTNDAFINQTQANYNYDIEHQNTNEEVQTTEVQAAAAAAAAQAAANLSNIINFNQMDHERASSTPSDQHRQQEVQQHRQSNHEQLHFLQNALAMDNQASSEHGRSLHSPSNPKQVLVQDPSSQMSIVVVNPGSSDGGSRLGRPRKHSVKLPPNFEDSSSKNYEESLVSRFRVDSKPVSGPGSRGGRKPKSKPKILSNTGKPLSQQPIFAKNGNTLKLLSQKDAQAGEPLKVAIAKKIDPNVAEVQPDTTIILEDVHTLKAKGRSTVSDEKILQAQASTRLGLVPLAAKPANFHGQQQQQQHQQEQQQQQQQQQQQHSSSTTLTSAPPAPQRKRTRKKRDIPGPITGAFNDSYDPEILKPRDQKELDFVALGYFVKPAPYARDIITVLSFFNKFKKYFKDLQNLSPQDIEEGLKLPSCAPYKLDNVIQSATEPSFDSSNSDVSETMNQLFFQLLGLLLNKKKAITPSSMPKALDEFKSQVLNFGLPIEWRNDSGVYADPLIDDSLKNNEDEEPVDPTHPEFFDTTQYHFDTSRPLDHTPLDNADFESRGLNSLEPTDRLVLLRSLVHWCTSYSDSIRNEITKQLAKQDSSGDKETYYISRFIKEGEAGVEQANISLKLHPRKKVKKNEDETTLDPYTDATANPLDHHMSFRIMDFYAGDAGVNGRFFLCRSSDPDTGGLSTMAHMKQVLESQTSVTDMLSLVQPSRFKLYVQDVTTMLKSLGSEIVLGDQSETLDPWYEVASNSEELREFTDFLQDRLVVVKNPQIQNLLDYLTNATPMLTKFETIFKEYNGVVTSRQSRKREQVTDLKENDRRARKMIKQAEQPTDDFLNDGSEMDEPEDGEDDDFDMDVAEPDDEDDDDYKD
jgi:hypothetical protein